MHSEPSVHMIEHLSRSNITWSRENSDRYDNTPAFLETCIFRNVVFHLLYLGYAMVRGIEASRQSIKTYKS